MFDRRVVLTLTIACAFAAPAAAAPVLGQPAPAFTAVGSNGKTRALSDFAGRTVVLEWTNDGCPYVQKHYNSAHMQGLQKQATAEGVVWLTVISSAPGFQGHKTGPQARQWKARVGAAPTDVILDPDGTVGRAYAAKTTPHMYVVDKAGKLVYMGGIDDRASADPASLNGAKNYVVAALADVKAGRPVAQPATRPYGCSVKYSSAD
ncbi:redoxin domain-containing protein [uncultured Phenylobacterium sp.]|uniref:redoxin domain-containing protein n=1 Tax=uncultured Phenylobacterium sp. TaxID=349273 RepID=UPI0025EBBF35|nr:redoxin domain-containing protein [uncultured Phenylobacterium sp.]